MVKVTAHLCLVKTFQGLVKRHVCYGVAAPQRSGFLVSLWNCLLFNSVWLLLLYLTCLNALWNWNYYHWLQLVNSFNAKLNKKKIYSSCDQREVSVALNVGHMEAFCWITDPLSVVVTALGRVRKPTQLYPTNAHTIEMARGFKACS